ncbi:MAG: hypothetical protein ACHQ4H_09765 [Ktedonobacterales bacterium]
MPHVTEDLERATATVAAVTATQGNVMREVRCSLAGESTICYAWCDQRGASKSWLWYGT